MQYIQETLPYVDTNRAVALGGSYGGYMINWIAGQPLAIQFKALVSHDSIFSAYSLYGSDLPNEFNLLFGGHLWEQSEIGESPFDRWDLARHTKNWSTPRLVIHSERDYRCPISMGLSAFSVLQLKGTESKFLTFSDESHLVSKPENLLYWYQVVFDWMNRFTGIESV